MGVSYTVDPKVRTSGEAAKNPVYPKKKETGEKEVGSSKVRARNIRRMASPERSGEEVMREITDYAQKREP